MDALIKPFLAINGGIYIFGFFYVFANEIRTLVVSIVINIFWFFLKLTDDFLFAHILVTDVNSVKLIKKAVMKMQILKAPWYEINYGLYHKFGYVIEDKLDLNNVMPFVFKDHYFYIREPQENILQINCLRYFDKIEIESFLEECRRIADPDEKFECAQYSTSKKAWMKIPKLNKINIKTMFLSKDMRILADDMDEFVNSVDYYTVNSRPYHRGYILHGPPGTGKTTVIKYLALKYGYEIYLISLAQEGLTDDDLVMAILSAPPKVIIVFEDIDSLALQKESQNNLNLQQKELMMRSGIPLPRKTLSLSTLLNIFDGITTKANMVFAITTNHYDKLREHIDEEAFFRPGRIDLSLKIDQLDRDDIIEYYVHHFSNIYSHDFNDSIEAKINKYADIFEDKLPDNYKISFSEMQAYLERYKRDFKSAVLDFVVSEIKGEENSESNIKKL